MGLATRLKLARLLLVTDARAASGDLPSFAADVFAGGVDVVELVDDGADDQAVLAALRHLRRAARPKQRLVAVFSDAALAGEFAADLLMLPDDSSSAAKARRSLHEWALIGRSCRSRDDIDRALADADVDYLIVNADLATVEYAAAKAPQGVPASKPWFAAGGITDGYLPVLVEAGCRRVAVSRAITRADDPRSAASALAAALKKAWNDDPAMEAVTFAAFGTAAPSASLKPAASPLKKPQSAAGGDGLRLDDPGL